MDSNKKTKSYFVDRISELPECIMHHILSFLPTKEVARTSVLSQRWNSVSTCFPILDFDESSFGVEGPSDYEALEKFINIVDCTLHKFCTRKLQVQKFKIFITHNHRFEIPVKKWIDQLTKNQVRELDFHTPKPKGRDGYYPVPQTTFAAKSLISLNLNGCYLAQPFSKDNIKCCSLTTLSLEEVYVTEMMIQLLISSCPLIEVIVLKNCQGFSKLSVSGLLKLKTIKVIPCVCYGLESINIESPSLQSFYFRFGSIFKLHTINVSACQGLRNVTLIRALVTNQMFLSIASNLPFLEYLFLASCDVPQRVKISSRRLMRLTLRDCEKLEEAEIDTPDLNSFQFVGQTLPLFSSLNAPCQLEVLLYLVTQPDALWHQKLNEFLKKANQAKVLTLIITSSEIIWNKNMEVVNEFSLRAPKTPAQWGLHMQSLSLSFSALLDKFLVNCCPNMLFIVSGSTSENKFVKHLCEKLMDRTYPYCCISRYFDFWWKMLNVKIANFEETKDGKPLCCNALLEEAMPTLHERQKFCFRLQWEYPHTCGGQTELLRSLE